MDARGDWGKCLSLLGLGWRREGGKIFGEGSGEDKACSEVIDGATEADTKVPPKPERKTLRLESTLLEEERWVRRGERFFF